MRSLILISAVITASITGSQAHASDLQSATDDVCACLKAPYQVVQKALGDLQQAQASGDYSALTAAQEEMMSVMSASSGCFEKLPQKYPDIDQNDELKSKVMAMANEQCPNPATAYQR